MIKWIKDIVADIKQLILAPLSNILCGAGILLVFASFVQYNKVQGLVLHGNPYLVMTIIGVVLIAVGVVLFIISQREARFHTHLNYEKGIAIKRGDLTIMIKTATIEQVQDATRNSVIVLPANTTFVDDCITDKRSALGAFFIEHFPNDMSSLPFYFKSALDASGMHPSSSGQYSPGTTILLPEKFSSPAKLLITASTMRTEEGGISSNPYIICNCVEGIFRATVDKRVDTIYMPVLGSGHGGVDRGLALLFLLLSIMHFSKTFHHVKKVNILVHPKDVESLNRSKELRLIIAL